jgi:hypothetical protein
MANARPSAPDPFAGTPLSGTAATPAVKPDPFGGFYDSDPAPSPDPSRSEETEGSGSEESGIGGQRRLGLGMGEIIGDAPPIAKPIVPNAPPLIATPNTGATAIPRKRGRPAGSKNKGTPATQVTADSNKSWFGGTPLPQAEAAAGAKVCTLLLGMPLKLAARLKKNPAFALDPQEAKDICEGFTEYMMIRGDILGYWGPEMMLCTTIGVPLYMRYVMWTDPEEAKAMKEEMAKALEAAKLEGAGKP